MRHTDKGKDGLWTLLDKMVQLVGEGDPDIPEDIAEVKEEGANGPFPAPGEMNTSVSQSKIPAGLSSNESYSVFDSS